MDDLDNIRIVLIATSHAGNIGAVARAMKTMSLSRLVLVRPQGFPSVDCTTRACGADDLLAQAQVHDDLAPAIHDCRLVIGSSARKRTVAWPTLDPKQTALRLLKEASLGPVALLFGRERTGLTNAELDHCQALAYIPSNPDFASLNVAAAVQLFAYEIRLASLQTASVSANGNMAAQSLNNNHYQHNAATMAELESMFEHLSATIKDLGFADPDKSRRLMRRLRRLFYRAQPDRNEINILRGLLSAAQHVAHGQKTLVT